MSGPRVALGMTLHNNARHLPEALDSLLSQRYGEFALLLLDDGSTDGTEALGRACADGDARVSYRRHAERQGMVPTWRAVAAMARRDHPAAEYFAWVSDHDRWHPDWLRTLVAGLDARPDAVLAYSLTPRIDEAGQPTAKAPRTFDTTGLTSAAARWRRFCSDGVGSGDMVYGLVRVGALADAGTFRPVLSPDRLLIAELTLQGQVWQAPEPLWWRRESAVASVRRQRDTLVAGRAPWWFVLPPTWQHVVALGVAYRGGRRAALGLSRGRLAAMLARYVVTSAWRFTRKTEVSKRIGRGVTNTWWAWKVVKKAVRHAVFHLLVWRRVLAHRARRTGRKLVYHTLVGGRAALTRARRLGRRIVYELLVLTHRLGLRSPR